MPGAVIRDETPADADSITEVTVAAFATLAVSDQTEQHVIAGLRAAGALTVSLVAEEAGRVVGHVALSPVTIADGTREWYGLGPVSVLPERQGRGLGTALVRAGLARVRALGAQGCVVVGHPEYYPRFGFEDVPGLVCPGVPPEVFFGLRWAGPAPRGEVSFHPAFLLAGPPADGG